MALTKEARKIWIEQLDRELFRFCGQIFVAPALNSYPEQMIGNGTYALIDTGKKRVLVTCCHVWDEYEKHHDVNPEAIIAISLGDGNSCFAFRNPNNHLVSIDRDLDLVALEFELKEIPFSILGIGHFEILNQLLLCETGTASGSNSKTTRSKSRSMLMRWFSGLLNLMQEFPSPSDTARTVSKFAS